MKELLGIHILLHHYRQHQAQSNPQRVLALVYVHVLPENRRATQQVSCYDDKKGTIKPRALMIVKALMLFAGSYNF